tara:strand:+ start:269 stop:1126 length:858 start_codon:yes stop_codon:yes gene_type:complete
MAKPASREELTNYCLRQLGEPVVEVNVADEQIEDLIDDGIQYFQERHFDGVERMYLKYKLTEDDVNRGKATNETGSSNTLGITTTSGISTTVSGMSDMTNSFYETSNFIQVPDSVIGIEKIFKFDSSTISGGMFSIKYQLFLNDLYQFNSVNLLQYSMTKTYLEDIDFLLTTDKQLRFNKRQGRLYIDMDWGSETKDTYLIIDCYRILDPNTFTGVYNDSFLKKYVTALIKRQWGQNLLKFRGTRLPGGVELNGRELYEDAQRELDDIKQRMTQEYELPPYDFIG